MVEKIVVDNYSNYSSDYSPIDEREIEKIFHSNSHHYILVNNSDFLPIVEDYYNSTNSDDENNVLVEDDDNGMVLSNAMMMMMMEWDHQSPFDAYFQACYYDDSKLERERGMTKDKDTKDCYLFVNVE